MRLREGIRLHSSNAGVVEKAGMEEKITNSYVTTLLDSFLYGSVNGLIAWEIPFAARAKMSAPPKSETLSWDGRGPGCCGIRCQTRQLESFLILAIY